MDPRAWRDAVPTTMGQAAVPGFEPPRWVMITAASKRIPGPHPAPPSSSAPICTPLYISQCLPPAPQTAFGLL